MNAPATIENQNAPPDSLYSVVGASGQRYAFFMRDGSIRETVADDGEAALEWLGKQIGKCSHMQRHWLLQEIETCLTNEN